MAQSFPTGVGFTSSSFNIIYNTKTFKSAFSMTQQRLNLSGGIWVATYSLPIMPRANYEEWKAFFSLLQGRKGTFNAYDPEGTTARGIATGTPLVNGASQTGTSLITDGWTPSTTNIMRKGDYFSVGGELKMMTSDVNSDVSGNATLTFTPQIRNAPSDNSPLTVSGATVEMYIDSNITTVQTDLLGNSTPISFSGVEAV